MHLTRVENSDTKRVSLFWHTRYSTLGRQNILLVKTVSNVANAYAYELYRLCQQNSDYFEQL